MSYDKIFQYRRMIMSEVSVFNSEILEEWLDQRTNEILASIKKEKITPEDMLTLSLKAQINHFHHMDIEFRQEFRGIDERFEKVDERFVKMDLDRREEFKAVDMRFVKLEEDIKEQFKAVDNRFNKMDERFEKMDERFVKMDLDIRQEFKAVDTRFNKMEEKMNLRFEKNEEKLEARLEFYNENNQMRFAQMDKKFDRMSAYLMWGSGLLATLQVGLYLVK